MRRIQIKIWPEIEAQYPAIICLERIERNKINPIDIDFTHVNKVSSSGLNILLINIIKITNEIHNRSWDIITPKDKTLDSLIGDLNFYTLLLQQVPNQNLFWNNEIRPLVEYGSNGVVIKKYPIYELAFIKNNNERRKAVEDFKSFLITELFFLQEQFGFEVSTFIQILVEMAKNSADHTNTNAYFGLDIHSFKESIKIKFSFGDLGIGLNQSIRKFINQDNSFKDKEKHLAITDSYHWALQIGTTTKPNSRINKGIGMSTIYNMSKQLEINFSVYDAESRGLLSSADNITHVELRKLFYAIGFKVGFYYYGETEIKVL